MPTDDRIQPPAGNPPAPTQTAVTTTPGTPSAPATTAPAVPNPLATRMTEIWAYIKPYLTPRVVAVVVGIGIVIVGYFLIDHFFFDKGPNSKRWWEFASLNAPSKVRLAMEKVRAEDRNSTANPEDPYPPSLVYRRLVEDFVKEVPADSIQARVTRVQLGRYLYDIAIRDIYWSRSSDKPRVAEILKTLAETYEKLEPQLASEPILQEEVILMQGKVWETLGEVEKAETFYRKLADDEKRKNGASGKNAAASLKRLDPDKNPQNRQEAKYLAAELIK